MRLGTWLHELPTTRTEADTMIERLAAMGITTLIAAFKNWTGPAYYPSEIAYTQPGFADGGLLGHLIDRCHDAGVDFEAWTCTFTEAGPSKLTDAHPECRALNADGTEYRVEYNGGAWACPAQQATQDYELSFCREVLARYPAIDRLHLDYIRYPNAEVCRCAYCQTEFRELYGFDLLTDVMPGGSEGKAFDAFVRWRCGHIKRFVSRAHDLAAAAGKQLTAAVFPYYPSIMYDMGQDWLDWCRDGLLDAAYPMNYNWSDLMVERYTTMHRQLLGQSRVALCEGLGLKDGMSAADVQSLSAAALDHGSDGVIFFECHTLVQLPLDTLAPWRGNG